MPVSLASLPGAVKKAGERGIRDGIRKELTRPTVTFGTGATIFYVSYAMQKRKQRLKRMEQKLDRLDDKTEVLQETNSDN
jgi:hypothetical protein